VQSYFSQCTVEEKKESFTTAFDYSYKDNHELIAIQALLQARENVILKCQNPIKL